MNPACCICNKPSTGYHLDIRRFICLSCAIRHSYCTTNGCKNSLKDRHTEKEGKYYCCNCGEKIHDYIPENDSHIYY